MPFFIDSLTEKSEKEISEIIRSDEERYFSEVRLCAEKVLQNGSGLLLLAGGSCCGKTTTAFYISSFIKNAGKTVFTFSTDDFFFDDDKAPINPDGTKNYDKFSHTDSDYICQALKSLVNEEMISLPTFDYKTRKRKVETYLVDPNEYDLVILEGIHALNDKLISAIPENYPFTTALLSYGKGVMINEKESLSPTELRFIRRLIRDAKHRGANAEETFGLWDHVISEEKDNIEKFIGNAEIFISSEFNYEVAVEKKKARELLGEVRPGSRFYEKARELSEKLSRIPDLDEGLVPENSVINEFIK